MYIESRLIGSSAKRKLTPNVDTIEMDWERFLYNIAFMDHYILDSIRLREIPFLIRKFGYLGLRSLISSPNFSMRCEAYNVGLLNLDNVDLNRCKYLYKIFAFDVANREDYLNGCFKEKGFNEDLDGYITEVDKVELIDLVSGKLLSPPVNPLIPICKGINSELIEDTSSLKKIIGSRATSVHGKPIKWNDIELNIDKREEDVFFVNNNLSKNN